VAGAGIHPDGRGDVKKLCLDIEELSVESFEYA
jgi:hypothetical protein